jgi:D-alanine-D-alanine ligase
MTKAAEVLILYNEPVLPRDHPDAAAEHEVLETVAFVRRTLVGAGFAVALHGAGNEPAALLRCLDEQRPQVVFNLFEGTADKPDSEAVVTGLLEWLGVSFTGCPSQALVLARNKHQAKLLFRGAGLPTADFVAVDRLPVPAHRLRWPLIVKPAAQDASVGLDQKSVVTDGRRLEERVAYLLETYGPPVLVEEFIDGREMNVALLETHELQPLPVSEVEFTDPTPGHWPIITYDAKWKPESRECRLTPPRYPADVAVDVARQLQSLAVRAYHVLGCRDLARVDFRLRSNGEPFILEVNPNPSYHPEAGYAAALQSAGLTHAQVTVDLVRAALERSTGGNRLVQVAGEKH